MMEKQEEDRLGQDCQPDFHVVVIHQKNPVVLGDAQTAQALTLVDDSVNEQCVHTLEAQCLDTALISSISSRDSLSK